MTSLPFTLRLHFAVVRDDAVVVPLGRRLRAFLGGKATLFVRRNAAADGHLRAIHGKDIAVRGIPFVLAGHIEAGVEHLHLDAARIRRADRRKSIAPHKHAGVSALRHVPPFQFEDEIFVHPLRANHPDWPARGDQHAVAHAEGARRDVHRHPAGEVFAVEDGRERFGSSAATTDMLRRMARRAGSFMAGGWCGGAGWKNGRWLWFRQSVRRGQRARHRRRRMIELRRFPPSFSLPRSCMSPANPLPSPERSAPSASPTETSARACSTPSRSACTTASPPTGKSSACSR